MRKCIKEEVAVREENRKGEGYLAVSTKLE